MTFALYDADVGGNLIGTIGPLTVDVTNGLYDVDVPFPTSTFSAANRYVEIVVNSQTLAPRLHLGSAPFAYVADTLDGLDSTAFAKPIDIDTRIAAHATNPLTNQNLQIDAAQLLTGTLSPDRLAASSITGDKVALATITADKIVGGSGSGLDADKLDGFDSSNFQLAANVGPKTLLIDAGQVSIPDHGNATLGPFDLDGYDTVSIQLVTIAAPEAVTCSLLWTDVAGQPMGTGNDYSGGAPAATPFCPGGGSAVVHLNVTARYISMRVFAGTLAGTYVLHYYLYLRRVGA